MSSNAVTPKDGAECVLVVDDQLVQRKKMSLAVEALGYRAIPATDGADALAKLAGEPDNEQAALSLATDPLGPLPEDMDLHEMAAWSIVANIILNLDEIFQKR